MKLVSENMDWYQEAWVNASKHEVESGSVVWCTASSSRHTLVLFFSFLPMLPIVCPSE